MMRVRQFEAGDAAAVAALHAAAFPAHKAAPSDALAAYFRALLLESPWHDPELPSWLVEEDGRTIGFFGVFARRMVFAERRLRVAVGCQFMVDPARRRSFAALELMRRFFSGPQDLSIADGANDAARRCWEAFGGLASPLHSLHWVRLLRPARGLLHLATANRRMRALNALGAPLASLADACVGRFTGAAPLSDLREAPLEAEALAGAIHGHRHAFALRPAYDAPSLAWLLAEARAKRRHGALQGALLVDAAGRAAGWFLYYLNRQVSKVLSVGGARETLPAVLDSLFEHARKRGSAAVEGRLEPHLAPALTGKHCLFQERGIATLLHARERALLVPFLTGDALFTRLEGEWWTRFIGEPEAQAPSRKPPPAYRVPSAADTEDRSCPPTLSPSSLSGCIIRRSR